MPLFIPKPLQYDAVTHDGTFSKASEVAEWIRHYDSSAVVKIELMDTNKPLSDLNYYVVVYETESGYDVVVPTSWILWRGDGSFMQYDDQEFKLLFASSESTTEQRENAAKQLQERRELVIRTLKRLASEEVPNSDIAELMGLSESTVRELIKEPV